MFRIAIDFLKGKLDLTKEYDPNNLDKIIILEELINDFIQIETNSMVCRCKQMPIIGKE